MAPIVDVTERKTSETLLRERAEELQRSNAEREQFAHVASHDLQEPLPMVASNTELLAERYQGKLDAKTGKYIGYAVDGAKRMQRLVKDLLAFSRAGRQQGSSEAADLNVVVQEVVKGLERAIAQAKATVEIGPLPVATADARQIAQVFQNLIGNAVKFHGERAPVVRISAAPFGSGWKFSVADNGIGIDPQDSGRIFQMFQRLYDHASYEGNGGRIWFESVPGEGTTFYFTLLQNQEKAA
jgi:light-regulated signal transduction histidine kinase (bacteriophytochrome)